MPTAKKLYTFNETINKTGLATLMSQEASMAYIADEGNYITAMFDSAKLYIVPILMGDSESVLFYVYSSNKKPLDADDYSSWSIMYAEVDGVVAMNYLSGAVCEITEIGANMMEWVAANTTTNGFEIPVESPNGVRLLLAGKTCDDDIAVVPKLTDGSATPSRDAQTVPIPEGFAGFRTFKVEAIPNTYVPEGYVPEGTVPEGYVKPEGEVVVTENVTGMDITDKKTLTVAVEAVSLMNIVFGDTAPEDTDKLWIKTAEPDLIQVKMSSDFSDTDAIETVESTLPNDPSIYSATTVGNNIYIFGSCSEQSKQKNFCMFNTKKNTVETINATLPTTDSVQSAYAAAVGDKIYIFGGRFAYRRVDTIYMFNTQTNTVEMINATLPTPADCIITAAVGDKIYLFGGYDGSIFLDTINVFDTKTNTIDTLDARLYARLIYASAAVVGDKIYLFGGRLDSTVLNEVDSIYMFDTKTNSIKMLNTKMPTAIELTSAAAVGDKIYIFGGHVGQDYVDTIYMFDTVTNTIEKLSATYPILGTSSVVAIGNKIYCFRASSNNPVGNSIYVFYSNHLPKNHMLIEGSGTDNIFDLLPNVEMGVKNVYLGNADGKGERVPAALYKEGAWVEI
jgi:N-acetylneuraminic acid mutarotase